MKIDGRAIADQIKNELKIKIDDLKSRGVTPTIAIVTVGQEDSWKNYVSQKEKVAKELGIDAQVFNLENAGEQTVIEKVKELDSNPKIHGIIVQRPLPKDFDKAAVINAISADKDVDGFSPTSKFSVPVWLAVKKLLEVTLGELGQDQTLINQHITVLGKGETAGGPVRRALLSLGAKLNEIDSKTPDASEIIRKSDIVISCVGKSGVVNKSNIKRGAILIGVGTHSEDGKLRGDYNEEDVEQIAAAYTPTPGGVGPVNLSYLFSNLVQAATA